MNTRGNYSFNQIRAKVIVFRDYFCDGPYAMLESDFFLLPHQELEFHDFVSSIKAEGGGDEPENALEAIALAMKSDWVEIKNPQTEKARNIIIVFTDASAHPFEKSSDNISEYYPADMLKSYDELCNAWCGDELSENEAKYKMNRTTERLVIFAPEHAYPWSQMADDMINTIYIPISEAEGGIEINGSIIASALGASMI